MTDGKSFESSLETISGITVRRDEPLSRHTTFQIGGVADYYIEPSTAETMKNVLAAAKQCGVRTKVIGRGSNLLFADAGFRGAVISTAGMKRITVSDTKITADAGASLTALAKAALDASLTGLEFANGIPGSVGGAVFMNAGAYDGEISQVLIRSTYYDSENGEFVTAEADAHAFAYRHSVYREHPERTVVSAEFQLKVGDPATIRARMEELMARRIEKQPLEYPSAGSVFKRYPGRYTAQMIDEAGLKGKQIGGAQVSEKHAGFIINRGGATAADVLALIGFVRAEIRRLHGIEIEPEIVFVPENG